MTRGKFSFWLDFRKDDELLVAEAIDELKTHRSFSSAIRDGIMIIKELRQGRVDLLLKLYPFVKEAIIELAPPPAPPTPQSFDMDELWRRMEAYMEQGRAIPDTRESGFPAMQPALKQSGKGIGQGVTFSLPVLDDDEMPQMTVKLAPLTGATNGSNLISGILGMEQ